MLSRILKIALFLVPALAASTFATDPDCCEDDTLFSFGKYPFQGEDVLRTCEWITENPEATERRRDRWCSSNFNGGPIIDTKCPVACGDCPSCKKDCCDDDETFSFGTFDFQDQTILRTCAWIISHPDAIERRRKNWCRRNFDGGPIIDTKCPVACGDCDSCGNPTCDDNPDYTFGSYEFEGQQVFRTCAWFSENPAAEERRKEKWCLRNVNGSLVQDQCPEACDKPGCGQCEDDSSFTYGTYVLNGQIVTRDCAWILENPDRIEVRRKNWCNRNFQGGDIVNTRCPLACALCDVPSATPSASPSVSPTFDPTASPSASPTASPSASPSANKQTNSKI